MTASNLSLCIAPSLLWHKKKDDPSLSAPAVTFLIDHCVELFGEDVLHLLGEAQEPRSADSGTDSESMHSVLSMHDGSSKRFLQNFPLCVLALVFFMCLSRGLLLCAYQTFFIL